MTHAERWSREGMEKEEKAKIWTGLAPPSPYINAVALVNGGGGDW